MNSIIPSPRTMIRALAIVATLGFVRIANAQPASPQSQQADVPTSYEFQASNVTTPPMSFEEVRSITQSSIRGAIGEQLGGITSNEVATKLIGSTEKLLRGQTVCISANLIAAGVHSLTQEHILQARVNFERRPIGGILSIKVALVPLFSGVGSASRPIAAKSVTSAVENLDEQTLASIISELSHQLGSEFAAK